ncbi:hypothetical protein [Methylobrevis pamukkalensis]|uniref:Magnesium transporter CorA n=1 Tax=Methylobrevis pamukkalensis TaxID=1439726 RepID=A0A1E3H7H5_9HYPH|nr:hypothetical protein [Methylobrevis pamukkalensis]ODN72288.1 hypothetical protein A6302_00353 [Methylobrevis pamukkalensis]
MLDQERPPTAFAGQIPGLVWIYRFDADGTGQALHDCPPAQVSVPDDGFLWLHLSLADARLPAFLARLPLPEAALTTLVSRDRHTGLQADEGVVHGTLPDFETRFDARRTRRRRLPASTWRSATGWW